ncbi:hypothetical protein HBB16_20175 [Pseudonocardia sp. MCCB 268]|nr:hypothetical protein [Pseudonocardia cytotoxica]
MSESRGRRGIGVGCCRFRSIICLTLAIRSVYRQATPHGEHTSIVCDIRPRRRSSTDRYAVTSRCSRAGSTGWREIPRDSAAAGRLVSARIGRDRTCSHALARAIEMSPTRDVAGPASRHTIWRVPEARQTTAAVCQAGRRHLLHRRRAPPGGGRLRSGPARSRPCAPRRAVRGLPARRAAAGLLRPARWRARSTPALVRPARGSRRPPGGRRAEALASGIAVNLTTAAGTYSGHRPPGAQVWTSRCSTTACSTGYPGTEVELARAARNLVAACDADGRF